ncbi:hypothetical protein [Azospirillum griseum]|uniref:Transposase n=1 Tax=Azospirillum griseum TaxID=2496639 RepID=A0A3S0HXI7_9PROT|nr:hypothetical protein [Azospirillum griseum]RTR15660.1 hypothetical protein EJ903_22490 [Azospirillum griseum]
MARTKTSGCNPRAKVEGQIGRWKQVLGPTLRFHTDQAQTAETAIGTAALTPMLDLGRPNSVRLTGSAVGRFNLRNSSPRCNAPTQA